MSSPRSLHSCGFIFILRALALLAVLIAQLPSSAQPVPLPQPALLPSANPLCDSNLVPCLDIDEFAAHAYAHLLVLPHSAQRDSAAVIPYGISLGLLGRIAGGIATHYAFWQEGEASLRRYGQHGPLRLSLSALLWPLLPLRQAPMSEQHEDGESHFVPPRHLRIGLVYEHELRVGPFDGANQLGMLADLATLRLVATRTFGPIEITASAGALYDWRGTFATGEGAVQLGVYLPFFKALKLYGEALGRGGVAYVREGVTLPARDPEPLRAQGVLGLGLSFRPHARVDLGVSVQRGLGGLAPSSVIARFAVLSVGKTYQGRAATPVAQLAADATVEIVSSIKEYVDSLPIDPVLDERCMLVDDDGEFLVDQPLGERTADKKHCIVQGEKLRIGEHWERDKRKSVVCYDKALRDCLMYRRPNAKTYRVLHRPWVGDDCVLRENVYDPAAPTDPSGRSQRTVELAVLGPITKDRKGCTDPMGFVHPVGARYYREHGHLWICDAPRIEEQRDRCFMSLPELPQNIENQATPLGRIARKLDHGLMIKATKIDQIPDQVIGAAEDIAEGRVTLETAGSAIKTKALVIAKHANLATAKTWIRSQIDEVKEWAGKPAIEQAEDLAKESGDALVPHPVSVAAAAVAGPLGRGALRAVDEAEDAAKLSKKARKAAARAAKNGDAVTDHAASPAGLVAAARTAFHKAPDSLPGFPDARRVRSKTSVQGGGKLRARWVRKDGQILEWDYQHGAVEVYDKRGKHLGEFDAKSGELLKPKDPNRKIDP